MRTTLLAAAIGAVLYFAAPVQAVVWEFNDVFLDGLQETPPVATPASGHAIVTYNDVTGLLSWDITFQDLIGTITAAHFHGPAPPGEPAGIRVGIPIGVSPLVGSDTISPAFGQELLRGLWYINIHSTFRPGGEIRGQLPALIPEPATCGLLAVGVALLLIPRRRGCVAGRDQY